MSTTNRVTDAAERRSTRPTSAVTSLAAGVLAVVAGALTVLLPAIVEWWPGDAWSKLGWAILGPIVTATVAIALAVVAIVAGILGVRHRPGRGRAVTGIVLGGLVIVGSAVFVALLVAITGALGAVPA